MSALNRPVYAEFEAKTTPLRVLAAIGDLANGLKIQWLVDGQPTEGFFKKREFEVLVGEEYQQKVKMVYKLLVEYPSVLTTRAEQRQNEMIHKLFAEHPPGEDLTSGLLNAVKELSDNQPEHDGLVLGDPSATAEVIVRWWKVSQGVQLSDTVYHSPSPSDVDVLGRLLSAFADVLHYYLAEKAFRADVSEFTAATDWFKERVRVDTVEPDTMLWLVSVKLLRRVLAGEQKDEQEVLGWIWIDLIERTHQRHR